MSGRSNPAPDGIPIERPAEAFPLSWSAYALLLRLKSDAARRFYETEALRGGWSVRQLRRQIDSRFYERTALSRNKTSMLATARERRDDDALSPEEAIKDPPTCSSFSI